MHDVSILLASTSWNPSTLQTGLRGATRIIIFIFFSIEWRLKPGLGTDHIQTAFLCISDHNECRHKFAKHVFSFT